MKIIKNELHQKDFLEEAVLVKVAKNAGLGVAGKILFYLLHFFTAIFIARTVGPAGYGLILLAYSLIVLTAMAASLGLTEGILRYVSFYQSKHDAGRVKGILSAGLILILFSSSGATVFLLVSAHFWSDTVFSKPGLALLIKIFSLAVIPLAVSRILIAGLQGLQLVKFRIYVENIIRPVSLIISVLLLAGLMGLGLKGVVSSYLISIWIGCLVSVTLVIKYFPFLRQVSIRAVREYKQLLTFSLPLLGVSFLTFSVERIDIFMVGYFRPAAQVGIYGAASRMANFVLLPSIAFFLIFMPMVAAYHGQGEKEKILFLLKSVTKWIITLSLPLFSLVCLFSREIMLVFGPLFLPGKVALMILSLAWMFQNGTGPAYGLIMMTGHSKINLVNYSLMFIFDFFLNLLLIPKYGIRGAALATAISLALVSLIRLGEIYWLFKDHPYRKDIFKPLLGAAVAFGAALICKLFIGDNYPFISNLILTGITFGAFYIGLLIILGLSRDDRVILRMLKQKIFR